jgi:hypothetical protein
MPAIIAISLTKEQLDSFPKTAIYEGKKTYYKMSVIVNDENDKFGQNVTVTAEQTAEERSAKAPKVFIGNGKVVWVKGDIKTSKELSESGSKDEPF